jgi:predicted SAM-dependent methyltransferase
MLRNAYLKLEPTLFALARPVIGGRRTRLQRSVAAQQYLKGTGLELGALAQPMMVPRAAKVLYVDRFSLSAHAHEKYLDGHKLVEPDFIDDGMVLSTQADNSADFLIASHMLEHADDPIKALKNWVRVVKPGGHILVIIPDRRFNADRSRELTTFEHLVRDHEEGPHVSNEHHYRDIATNKKKLKTTEEIEEYVRASLVPDSGAPHYHVWEMETFTEFLIATNRYLGRPYELIEAKLNVGEALCVLRVR